MDRSSTIVLVVDDEPDVRAVIFLHLKKAGYTVLEAASGEQALAILAVQPEQNLEYTCSSRRSKHGSASA